MKSKWDSAAAWLSGLGARAKDAIGNIKDKFLGVGRAIVSGIREGITAAWDGLKEKLRALVSGLPAAAKKVLGIRSPSRVFADEIGKPAAQGIGVGFSKAMGGVYAKMQQAVTGEMGRFASVVTPSLQLRQAAVAGSTNMTINYNQPVRTYSETVRAQRDLMRGLVTSV
jgi:phage-related protein